MRDVRVLRRVFVPSDHKLHFVHWFCSRHSFSTSIPSCVRAATRCRPTWYRITGSVTALCVFNYTARARVSARALSCSFISVTLCGSVIERFFDQYQTESKRIGRLLFVSLAASSTNGSPTVLALAVTALAICQSTGYEPKALDGLGNCILFLTLHTSSIWRLVH